MPRFYTTHQVAQLMGVTIPTVVSWCERGMIDAHRTPGGHRRIAREDLAAFASARGVNLPRSADDRASRILIVDDERDFSEMLRDYLVIKGFEVAVAHSGFQAGLEVGRFDPDLVLLDILMPDADGFEVLRTLREDPQTSSVPVVACTAFRDAALDARVARERFDGFVEKPLNMSGLLDLIRKTLDIDEPSLDQSSS
ncbi:MAG: response regulator [Myxococcota bacterium]